MSLFQFKPLALKVAFYFLDMLHDLCLRLEIPCELEERKTKYAWFFYFLLHNITVVCFCEISIKYHNILCSA